MPARKQADMAFLAEVLKRTGVDTDPDVEALKDAKGEYARIQLAESVKARQQSGVLRQLHHVHSMEMKTCASCKKTFKTSYCYEIYCSDECRDRAFQLHYGVTWESLRVPTSLGDWHYEPVLGVTPEIIEGLEVWARKFLADLDDIKSRVGQTTENQETSISRTERILRKFEQGLDLEDESTQDSLHVEPLLEDATASQSPVEHKPTVDPFDLDFDEFDVEPFQ